MSREPPTVEIRQATRRDADILTRLAETNPDSGDIGVAPQYATDPYDFYRTLEPDTTGFLAETPSGEAVGMGFVSIRQVRIGGVVRDVAFLRGLVVKRGYRGRGIGKRLAAERVEYVRTRNDDCPIVASIQASNEPSRAVAASWADSFAYDRTSWAVGLCDPPRPDAGYDIRHVRRSELPTVVDCVNAFYADAELYGPYRASDLAGWLFDQASADGLRHYVIARDSDRIVAGVDILDAHRTRWLAVANGDDGDGLPPSVPEGGEIRPRRVGNLWFADGYPDAARAVIDAVRTTPNGANRIWFQSGRDGAFATAGVTDVADPVVEVTTAVRAAQPRRDRPLGDLF